MVMQITWVLSTAQQQAMRCWIRRQQQACLCMAGTGTSRRRKAGAACARAAASTAWRGRGPAQQLLLQLQQQSRTRGLVSTREHTALVIITACQRRTPPRSCSSR
jgi:hypothetical protein